MLSIIISSYVTAKQFWRLEFGFHSSVFDPLFDETQYIHAWLSSLPKYESLRISREIKQIKQLQQVCLNGLWYGQKFSPILRSILSSTLML